MLLIIVCSFKAIDFVADYLENIRDRLALHFYNSEKFYKNCKKISIRNSLTVQKNAEILDIARGIKKKCRVNNLLVLQWFANKHRQFFVECYKKVKNIKNFYWIFCVREQLAANETC